MTVDDCRLADPSSPGPVDPTLPDRLADPAQTPVESEWTRRAISRWQDPEMLQIGRQPPWETESETSLAFLRGMLNALALSAALAAIIIVLAVQDSTGRPPKAIGARSATGASRDDGRRQGALRLHRAVRRPSPPWPSDRQSLGHRPRR